MELKREFGIEQKIDNEWRLTHQVGKGWQSKAKAIDRAKQIHGWSKEPCRVIVYDYHDFSSIDRVNIREVDVFQNLQVGDKIMKKKDHKQTGIIKEIINDTANIWWYDSAKPMSWMKLADMQKLGK